MDKGYLNEVKAILKSLVLSCPDKMTVEHLNRDYRDVEGEFIPFRRLGYKDIEQFLRSIPDTVVVFGSGPTAMVCFVPNEKSDHIHDMIMEQKKPSRKRLRSKGKIQPNKSTPSRGGNRYNNNAGPRRMPGQQFSAFQSTNTKHMTKTLTVWDSPLQQSSASKYQNHRPPCYPSKSPSQYTGYQLPQPMGINMMNLLQSLPKIEKKPIIGDQIKQLPNLMSSSCHITAPSKNPQVQSQIKTFQTQSQIKSVTTPSNKSEIQSPLKTLTSPTLQTQSPPLRIVSFSPDTKVKEQPTNILNGVKQPKSMNGVQAHKATKPEDIKRLPITPPRRSLNPISKSTDFNERDENVDKVVTKEADNVVTITNQEASSSDPISNKIRNKIFDISDENDKDIDLDEAVPISAANNIVFRLDFPEHSVRFGQKITPFVLADDVHIGSYIKIFIAEIHSPFKFWFHIHKEEHELDYLMCQIERFYTTLDDDDLRIPLLCLTPGQTCAACYHDIWHRAEIVAPPVNNKIKVSFVDYGTVSEVEVKHVKFLASCFAHLPAQALRGCLSHIKPRFLRWSHEATKYFLSLVSELMLYAKVTEIDRENRVLYMILCNTNNDEVIQINKALIQENFAVLNEDWQDSKINMNNGQRVRHPREDFPTFSMLESGEYPSFSELLNLDERGIDYESITDRIIFNKLSILNNNENAPAAIRKLPYFLLTTNPFRSDIIKELNGMTA